MSILVNKKSKVVVQGITGSEGTFHTTQMIEYGTNVVAGVTPGKGGLTALDSNVPVYNSVEDAIKETDANVSIIFVPPPFAADAILEAVEAELDLVVCITDGIPTSDMQRVRREMKGSKTRLVGPNCPGVLTPGVGKLGIIPGHICKPGRIGVVSRSGTLSYESAVQTAALGQSTIIGIGGDPVNGTNFVDALELFLDDPETDGIVLIGEIGGTAEVEGADFIKSWSGKHKKPVAAFVAGAAAPKGRKLGHAGAIVNSGAETADAKKEALKSAGVEVSDTITRIGEAMKKAMGG